MKKYLITEFDSFVYEEDLNKVNRIDRKFYYNYVATIEEDSIIVFNGDQINVKPGDTVFYVTQYAQDPDSEDKHYIKIFH